MMSGRFGRVRSPSSCRWGREGVTTGPTCAKRERGRSRTRRRLTIHVTENSRLNKFKIFGSDARRRANEDVMQEMAVQIVHLADLNLQDRNQPSPERTRRNSVA